MTGQVTMAQAFTAAFGETGALFGRLARAGKCAWFARAEIPWPVKIILGVAMVIKFGTFIDFGADELLQVAGFGLLAVMRPGLTTAIWRAAETRASVAEWKAAHTV